METLAQVVLALNGLTLSGVLIAWLVKTFRVGSWVSSLMADTVVVHTRDNTSIRGVMTEITDKEVVLRQAQYLQEGLPAILEGETGIPRGNIAFIQRLSVGTEALK